MCVVCLVCLPSQSEDQQRELVEHYAAVALHFTTGAGDSGGAGLFSSRPDFVATLFGSVHGCVCGVQSTVVVGRRVTVCVCTVDGVYARAGRSSQVELRPCTNGTGSLDKDVLLDRRGLSAWQRRPRPRRRCHALLLRRH